MNFPENPGAAARISNLLVVDADAAIVDLVRKAAALAEEVNGASGGGSAAGNQPQVRLAHSFDAAEAEMLRKPADVLLVNVQTSDRAGEGGVSLIRNLKRRYPRTDIIALSRARRTDVCLDVFRAGAADMLIAPFTREDVQRVLAGASDRRQETERVAQRHRRLRTVCRRLNKARHEISRQVDLLCNDLVRAYQEMAQQLNLTQTAAEFAQTLVGELDVEGVLRRTMEWILKKLGPVNAAIYLPAGEDHFALGAYLNLDTQADALLIEALGKTIVQQARGATPVSIEKDETLDELFGDEAQTLLGRQWLAVGCHTPRECLAVLVVFRRREPVAIKAGSATDLAGPVRGLVEAVAPILAERIEHALGLYQRLNPFPEEDDPDETAAS